jgi:hypothetical protein
MDEFNAQQQVTGNFPKPNDLNNGEYDYLNS